MQGNDSKSMKTRLIFLIIAAFLGIQTAIGQTEKQVASIRAEVKLIDKNIGSYTKTKKNVEDVSLEGTESTFFVSGRGLMKIIAKSYGETYRATTEFYYSGEELMFAFRKFSRYDTQVGLSKPVKIVSVKETRAYFSGDKLIKLSEGKVIIKRSSKKWSDSEAEMQALSTKLKAAFLD